jgi:TonB-dependent receptor
MLRISLLAILLSFLAITTQAQKGKIEGKVTDAKTGQSLAGVSVTVKSGQNGVSTDGEGRYVLNVNAGKITLVLSFQGFEKEVEGIEVIANKVTVQDITFEQKGKAGEAAIVRGSSNARKETAASLITFQKNTNTVASVISAETIRRSPDKNTGEVLKRTPGASIQEGKFIVVRGLADRYNQAMLNGILLTSTEPDRKTFSFDLIPASMVDNIVINKAFVPEYPGEWAGGLIQVSTKDIPAKSFFNIQIGTGFNTQTIGKTFLKDKGGKTDWLGIDDGVRGLPTSYKSKSTFDLLSSAEKTAIGKQLPNSWSAVEGNAPLNASLQLNGGFNTNFLGKKIGGMFGLVYSKTNRYLELLNRQNTLNNNIFSINSNFNDDRFGQDISWGAMGSLSIQLNALNKISVKSIVNINSTNAVTSRNGVDFNRDDQLKGSEFSFKQNTFFTSQVSGDHKITKKAQLKWYGAFNILDGYIPDQRRILYSKAKGSNDPYRLIISNTLSQQSGSRIFQNLSDYIYTAGGDFNYNFNLFSKKQSVKTGYMFQVKDRLFDAKLFANYLPTDNPALRLLPADKIFAIENFGNGTGSQLAFDAIKGNTFRYLANTILNAGFLQFDNQFTDELKVVWGLRVEHYDQLVGSVKASDPRHTHTEVLDFLPGLNATYKANNKVNIRLSGSQTVIRPELRELSFLNIFDFELNASVQGNPLLKRTKISNLDLRYEFYPRAGEVITLGAFYKKFSNPIEQIFNEGAGGSSTFSYQNAEKASSYGAEFEFRKKMDIISGLKNFTFQSNASYIYSRVKDSRFRVDRSLQGQSPYVLNFGLLYDLSKYGFSATLLYNRIGERIYLVGDLTSGAGSPDIFEAPRSLFDLQLSKKLIANKAEVRLNISDILAQTQYFYQNAGGKKSFQKNEDAFRFTRRFGTTFSVSFNYSL